MPKTPDLTKPVKYYRGSTAKGLRHAIDSETKRVDPTGGKYGHGIIRGASLIARGEAFGHGEWVDDVFLGQVARAVNESSKPLKVRFTHPSMSGDGLGTQIGHVFAAEHCQGECTIGDVHLLESGRDTPDGDLGGYVLKLAEEDPANFGMSIVYMWDAKAELEFELENQEVNEEGRSSFVSPDPENERNLIHSRLADLRAADFVDDPAANENGVFFSAGNVPAEADQLLLYALGLSETPATCEALQVEPDRARGFIARFLDAHNITLSMEGATVPRKNSKQLNTDTPDDAVENVTTVEEVAESSDSQEDITRSPDSPPENDTAPGASGNGMSAEPDEATVLNARRTECERYEAAFSVELGRQYFCTGLSMEKAQAEYNAHLRDENERMRQQLSALSASGGDVNGVGNNAIDGDAGNGQKKRGKGLGIKIAGRG